MYYVEALIGPDTVDTVPQATMQAFQRRGRARRTLDADVRGARETMAALHALGIDYDAVTRQLETEGVAQFVTSYTDLLAGVEHKRALLSRAAAPRKGS